MCDIDLAHLEVVIIVIRAVVEVARLKTCRAEDSRTSATLYLSAISSSTMAALMGAPSHPPHPQALTGGETR